MRVRMLLPAAGLIVAGLALSACSLPTAATSGKAAPVTAGPSGAPAGEPAEDGAVPAETPSGAAPKPAGGQKVLKVATVEGFSPFVVNAKGRTVYRFDKDTNKPPKSVCAGECAKTWEPIMVDEGFRLEGSGLDEGSFGTLTRAEGKQLTLKGWPLYYYKDDLKLGQTAGHGKNGTWFAIAPSGGKAQKNGGAGQSTDSGGYGY